MCGFFFWSCPQRGTEKDRVSQRFTIVLKLSGGSLFYSEALCGLIYFSNTRKLQGWIFSFLSALKSFESVAKTFLKFPFTTSSKISSEIFSSEKLSSTNVSLSSFFLKKEKTLSFAFVLSLKVFTASSHARNDLFCFRRCNNVL